jgi:hypothetical protein
MGRYTVHTQTGSKQKAVYGKTRKEVAEKLTKAMAERDGGLYFEAENLSVAEFLERWLSDCVRGSVRASTHATYRCVWCQIWSRCGHSGSFSTGCYLSTASLTPSDLPKVARSASRGVKKAEKWSKRRAIRTKSEFDESRRAK